MSFDYSNGQNYLWKNVNFLKLWKNCAYQCLINFSQDKIISVQDLHYTLSSILSFLITQR